MATKQRTQSPKPKIRRYDEGGLTEEDYKQRGLEASKGDSASFLDRMKAGNIDEPGSEAYNRWGAGYGRRMASQRAAQSSPPDDSVINDAATKNDLKGLDQAEAQRGRDNMGPGTVSSGDEATSSKPSSVSVEKKKVTVTKPSDDSGYTRKQGATAKEMEKYASRPGREKQGSPTYKRSEWDDDSMIPNDGMGLQKKNPVDSAIANGKKYGMSPLPGGEANAGTLGRNASNWDQPLTAAERKARSDAVDRQGLEESHPESVFMPMGSLKGLHALAKSMAGTGAKTTPVTFLGRSGAKEIVPAAERLGMKESAPRLTADSASRVSGPTAPRGLPQPPRRLSAPEREVASRPDVMKREAWVEGPGGRLGRQGNLPGMKKGGAVKAFANGGVVRASSRADGIAQRGKTRGKIT